MSAATTWAVYGPDLALLAVVTVEIDRPRGTGPFEGRASEVRRVFDAIRARLPESYPLSPWSLTLRRVAPGVPRSGLSRECCQTPRSAAA